MSRTTKAKRTIEATKGRFFFCRFIKRTTGEERRMIARTGVRKPVVVRRVTNRTLGKKIEPGLRFDPAARQLAVVWDASKQQYRMISLERVIEVRCGDLYYHNPELETNEHKRTGTQRRS